MIKERIFKSKVLVTVIYVQKNEDKTLSVVHKVYETMSGRELDASIKEDIERGIKRQIVEVDAAPEHITMGTVYVLRGGKRAWIYSDITA